MTLKSSSTVLEVLFSLLARSAGYAVGHSLST